MNIHSAHDSHREELVISPPTHAEKIRFALQWVSTVVATILVVLLLIFCVQNVHDVKICFLSWHFYFPLSLALILAFFLGGSLVAISVGQLLWQHRRKIVRKSSEPRTSK